MKILALTSSPRGSRSQTLRLANAILDGARQGGAETECVDVCALRIEYCRACDACHRAGTCIHNDDFAGLRAKVLAADGIVFTSPDYFRSVTAPLKTVIDRMADVIHCQLLSGKYGCSAATAGGPGAPEVTTYLNEVLVALGAFSVGSVAVSVGRGPDVMAEGERQAAALGSELAGAIASKRVYPEQAARHAQAAAYFRKVVEANRARWPYEYEFWERVKAG